MVQSNDFARQVEEITINVPWGHIACKWWGPKSVRPILCIHGWQDNANSFDPLICQLPDYLSYLAVDLPGHGLSSRIPDGMMYSLDNFFQSIILICNHFKWQKVSLMSHSLGSVLSFLYAAIFPDKCDMVIGLDALRPYDVNFKLIHRHYFKGIQQTIDADIRNRKNEEPPSYTYEELVAKLKAGIFIEISEESAPYLLQRSVQPSRRQPKKYYFSRDSRLKSSPIPMMAHDIVTLFARNIISPYCVIKSTMNRAVDTKDRFNIIVNIMKENPNFEFHSVSGDHHIHLNEPNKVSGILSAFIRKYRPVSLASKL